MTDLLANARDLGPSIAARAEAIEAARTLPDDVVADLRGAGLLRLFVPADLGGPEADVHTGIDAIAEVSRHDGGAGWSVMIAGTSSLMAGFLPEDLNDAHVEFVGNLGDKFVGELRPARCGHEGA